MELLNNNATLSNGAPICFLQLLPSELIGVITNFLHANKAALQKLSLTSKFWRTAAFAHLDFIFLASQFWQTVDYAPCKPKGMLILGWPEKQEDILTLEILVSSLQELSCQPVPLTAPSVEHLGQRLQYLTSFETFPSPFDANDTTAPFLSWIPSLTRLRRVEAFWELFVSVDMIKALADYCPLLETLQIDRSDRDIGWHIDPPKIETISPSLKKMTNLKTLVLWQDFFEISRLTAAVAQDAGTLAELLLAALAELLPPSLQNLHRFFVLTKYGEEDLIGQISVRCYLLRVAPSESLSRVLLDNLDVDAQVDSSGDTGLSYLLVSKQVGNEDQSFEALPTPIGFSTLSKIKALVACGADPFRLIGMPSLIPRPSREPEYLSIGTCFHLAALWADKQQVEALLSVVDWESVQPHNFVDACGYTPLHYLPRHFDAWDLMEQRFRGAGFDFLNNADNPTCEPPILCMLSRSQFVRAELAAPDKLAAFLTRLANRAPSTVLARRVDGTSLLKCIVEFFMSFELPRSEITALLDFVLQREAEAHNCPPHELCLDQIGLTDPSSEMKAMFLLFCSRLNHPVLLPMLSTAATKEELSMALLRLVCETCALPDFFDPDVVILIVDDFLKMGADINYKPSPETAERLGLTHEHPLLSYVTPLSLECVMNLIDRGADPVVLPPQLRPRFNVTPPSQVPPSAFKLFDVYIERGVVDEAILLMQDVCFRSTRYHAPSLLWPTLSSLLVEDASKRMFGNPKFHVDPAQLPLEICEALLMVLACPHEMHPLTDQHRYDLACQLLKRNISPNYSYQYLPLPCMAALNLAFRPEATPSIGSLILLNLVTAESDSATCGLVLKNLLHETDWHPNKLEPLIHVVRQLSFNKDTEYPLSSPGGLAVLLVSQAFRSRRANNDGLFFIVFKEALLHNLKSGIVSTMLRGLDPVCNSARYASHRFEDLGNATPLHLVLRSNLAIEAGRSIDARTELTLVLNSLLSHGADLTVKDNSNQTPLEAYLSACSDNGVETTSVIVDLLKDHSPLSIESDNGPPTKRRKL